MLTPMDDFPIHQAPRPIAVPATTDRNAYGRYWFGAMARSGAFQIEAAFGRYPNLGVTDAHLSIAIGGVQHAFHASGAAPLDPTDLRVGPFRLEIVEPMRHVRIVVDDNDTGVHGELEWRNRTGALAEDHTFMDAGPVRIIDMIRFTQFGTWAGEVTADGETTSFGHDEVYGIRDRSWGIRPVGTPPEGRPRPMSPNAWLWAPCHFDDECRLFGYFQRMGGEFWRADGFRVPVVDDPPAVIDESTAGVQRTHPVAQRLEFEPGTRMVSRAEFDLIPAGGEPYTIVLEPQRRFLMRGLGYSSPEWAHGVWHDELAIGGESWRFDDIAPLDHTAQHVHHLVKATIGDRQGIGILEQIIFGPHTQFGFNDVLDGASA